MHRSPPKTQPKFWVGHGPPCPPCSLPPDGYGRKWLYRGARVVMIQFAVVFEESYSLTTTPSFGVTTSYVCRSWSGSDSVSVWWKRGSWWKWKRWSTNCERNTVVFSTCENWPRHVSQTSWWIWCSAIDSNTPIRISDNSYPTSTSYLPTTPWLSSCFQCYAFFRTSRGILHISAGQSKMFSVSSATTSLPAHRFAVSSWRQIISK